MENKTQVLAGNSLIVEHRQPIWKQELSLQSDICVWLVRLFVLVTMACIFLPQPILPTAGLDPSWQMGMEWAIGTGMKIGQDVIFTFGPYASIYTKEYNPHTIFLQTGGGILLALCYSVAFLYLARERLIHGALLLVFTLLVSSPYGVRSPYGNDSLFLLYSLLLALCGRKYGLSEQPAKWQLKCRNILIFSLLCAPLGFLPLIKGSFVLSCGATVVLVAGYLLYLRRPFAALIAVVIPLMTALVSWSVSGQATRDFPHFFLTLMPIISGYTEAMALGFSETVALDGAGMEILAYVAAIIALLAISLSALKHGWVDKIFCGLVFLLFLFLGFKAGFTRHDSAHAMIAPCVLLLCSVSLGFLINSKPWFFSVGVAFIAFLYIGSHYQVNLISRIPQDISNVYQAGWNGMDSRFVRPQALKTEFDERIRTLREDQPLPLLTGNSDIYSFDQSRLLVSGNPWNPRPIFQSYSAYTKQLAQLNAQHLRGTHAPDNIFFRIAAIDYRFPALEDGVSWLALRDNYAAVGMSGDLLVLHKRATLYAASVLKTLEDRNHAVGEEVTLPASASDLFLAVDLKPTLLGRLLNVAFKPPTLTMTLTLMNGRQVRYRVIAGMMASGFVVSPLVRTTKDFYLFETGNSKNISSGIVKSFKLERPIGGGLFWNENYSATIFEYSGSAPEPLAENIFN